MWEQCERHCLLALRQVKCACCSTFQSSPLLLERDHRYQMRDYAFDLLNSTTGLMEENGTLSSQNELYVRTLNLTELIRKAASPSPTEEIDANVTAVTRSIAKFIKPTNFTIQERLYTTASTLQATNVKLAATDALTTFRSMAPPMNGSVVEKGAADGYFNYYFWIALFVAVMLIAQVVAVVVCCWIKRNRSSNRMELLSFRMASEGEIPGLVATGQRKRLSDGAPEVEDDASSDFELSSGRRQKR